MNLLAIDTSTERATVALLVNGEIYKAEQHNLREHAQFLLPMIHGLLAESEISIKQLQGIAFGCGPGSFTGLRIACSIAKALAYAYNLPLYPVSSLAAIAAEVYASENNLAADTQVVALIDARMHQLYWASFTGGYMTGVEQVLAAADISLPGTGPVLLAGAGFAAYVPQLSAAIQARVIKQRIIFPCAQVMLSLVQLGGVKAVSAAEALPVYVRNQVTHVAVP